MHNNTCTGCVFGGHRRCLGCAKTTSEGPGSADIQIAKHLCILHREAAWFAMFPSLGYGLGDSGSNGGGGSGDNGGVAQFDLERGQFLERRMKQMMRAADMADKACEDVLSRAAIERINRDHPLHLKSNWQHVGPVHGMALSHDGSMLAAASSLGIVRIFNVETCSMIQELRDVRPINAKSSLPSHVTFDDGREQWDVSNAIEEFYVVTFTPDDRYVVVGGKSKDRYEWDVFDEDNKILPCPLKIFDAVEDNRIVSVLTGHEEEILCLKYAWFEGDFYYVTGSYDGSIIKWKMRDDYITLDKSTQIMDGITNVVLSLDFVPNCGNKFFLAGCDNMIKLYDFEQNCLLQTFDSGYSSYCDSVKFVPLQRQDTETCHYFISRGVELLNEERRQVYANACHLHRIILPTQEGEQQVRVEELHTFEHSDYKANSWPMRISSNGRYLLAPTSDGKMFIWNLATGSLVAIFKDHSENEEVRDVLFHPTKPLLFTCSDGMVYQWYILVAALLTPLTVPNTDTHVHTDATIKVYSIKVEEN